MAGRSRNDGERHSCGKLVQRPSAPGIHPLIEQRRVLVGDQATDPRSSYPLGILYLRGAIMHGDYAAGMRFAGLYGAVWGKGQIRSHLEAVIYGLRGRDFDAADEARREKRLMELADELGQATAALLALGTRRPYDILTNIAVYERPLRFMDTARTRTPGAWAADERDREALIEATGTLAELWKIERKAA